MARWCTLRQIGLIVEYVRVFAATERRIVRALTKRRAGHLWAGVVQDWIVVASSCPPRRRLHICLMLEHLTQGHTIVDLLFALSFKTDTPFSTLWVRIYGAKRHFVARQRSVDYFMIRSVCDLVIKFVLIVGLGDNSGAISLEIVQKWGISARLDHINFGDLAFVFCKLAIIFATTISIVRICLKLGGLIHSRAPHMLWFLMFLDIFRLILRNSLKKFNMALFFILLPSEMFVVYLIFLICIQICFVCKAAAVNYWGRHDVSVGDCGSCPIRRIHYTFIHFAQVKFWLI